MINSSNQITRTNTVTPNQRFAHQLFDELPDDVSELVMQHDSTQIGSALTGSGLPLELSFATHDPRPRFTVDPYLTTYRPEQRLYATAELMEKKFDTAMSATTLQWLSSMQPEQQSYGAWLGLRQNVGGTGNKFEAKLYCEVESGIEEVYWSYLAGQQRWGRELTMLGVTMDDNGNIDQTELYFRSRRLMPTAFASLLEPMADSLSVSKQSQRLLQAIEICYGRKLGDRLPGGTAGFSYALDKDEEVQSLTLFLFARSFFGRDRKIRQRFSQLLKACGQSDSRYMRITQPSVQNLSAQTQHGMFSITMNRHAELSYGIGYCPAGVQYREH